VQKWARPEGFLMEISTTLKVSFLICLSMDLHQINIEYSFGSAFERYDHRNPEHFYEHEIKGEK